MSIHTSVGICTNVSSGGFDSVPGFPLQHKLLSKVPISSKRVVLQGSQLHEQPALGQSSQRTKLQSLEPNLAQHVGVVQLSARVAVVCLMHQLTALLTEKHAAVGSCHGEVAQHRTAAGTKPALPLYIATSKPLPNSFVLVSSTCCFLVTHHKPVQYKQSRWL